VDAPPPQPYPQAVPHAPQDGLISLVLAGVSLFVAPTAPVAIWFGVRGRRLPDESQRTMATIGLIVGIVMTALLALAVVMFLVIALFMTSTTFFVH
jgi:hypothetical protein